MHVASMNHSLRLVCKDTPQACGVLAKTPLWGAKKAAFRVHGLR